MKKILTVASIFIFGVLAQASDSRDAQVLRSKMVKAILTGLKQEQNLKCQLVIEEDGSKSIAYFDEDNLSKFSAGFLCDDGRTLIIKGVIADGGQTATESFQLGVGPS